MNELKFTKAVGEIIIKYEIENESFIITEAKLNENIFFKGKRKLAFVKKNNKEYMGLQIFNNEYDTFLKFAKINKVDNKAFISFPKETEEIIKREVYVNSHYNKEIERAKKTGEMVKVKIGMVACNDPKEECNWDLLTIEIYPDGSIKEHRQHTW